MKQDSQNKTPLCFNLFEKKDESMNYIFSFFIFGLLIPFISILITFFYIHLIFIIKISKKYFKNNQNLANQKGLKKSIFLLTFTNVIVWLPTSIFGTLYLFINIEISNEIYSWFIIFVIPINSIINPVIMSIEGVYDTIKNLISLKQEKRYTFHKRI